MLRLRDGNAMYMQMLNYTALQEELGEEYFIITRLAKKGAKFTNKIDIPGFSVDVTAEMLLKDALLISDIIVGDYRDTTFEAPLMNKPLYLTTWDKEEYGEKHAELYPYNDLIAGIEVVDTEDFIQKVKNSDNYDYSIQNQFKEKYLAYCDGNSSQRLFDYLMKDAPVEEVEPEMDDEELEDAEIEAVVENTTETEEAEKNVEENETTAEDNSEKEEQTDSAENVEE